MQIAKKSFDCHKSAAVLKIQANWRIYTVIVLAQKHAEVNPVSVPIDPPAVPILYSQNQGGLLLFLDPFHFVFGCVNVLCITLFAIFLLNVRIQYSKLVQDCSY